MVRKVRAGGGSVALLQRQYKLPQMPESVYIDADHAYKIYGEDRSLIFTAVPEKERGYKYLCEKMVRCKQKRFFKTVLYYSVEY